jgi:hypothetical protein
MNALALAALAVLAPAQIAAPPATPDAPATAPAPLAPPDALVIDAPALTKPAPAAIPQCKEPPAPPQKSAAVRPDALAPFAEAAHAHRQALALGAGAGTAAMLATSITYLIVSEADKNLDPKNAVDTRTAGAVIGLASLVPLGFGATQLLSTTPIEDDASALANGASAADVRARIATRPFPLLPVLGATALGVGGLASGALGGYFLALPHIPPHRGPISHTTGAELIGLGTAMIATGAITAVYAFDDTDAELAALTPPAP